MDSREALCGQIYAPSFLNEIAVINSERIADEPVSSERQMASNESETERVKQLMARPNDRVPFEKQNTKTVDNFQMQQPRQRSHTINEKREILHKIAEEERKKNENLSPEFVSSLQKEIVKLKEVIQKQ